MSTTTTATAHGIRAAAAEHFGHSSLLPGQEAAVGALLDGHDVLLVSPTGSGKSLAYQLAGVLLGGCTVVVSPLLALQKDQVDSLEEGVDAVTAARLSSAETQAQRRAALDAARGDGPVFLFMSPEQLANDEVLDQVAAIGPRLVAVDEAHCVSSWGHDFRPDYFRLGELVARLGSPRVVAMTATAARPVREDIVERLRLADHRTIVTGFERDNIALDVVRATDPEHQRRTVLATVAAAAGEGERRPGILYCRTRKGAEEYAAALTDAGHRTAVYHAGLPQRRRDAAHEAFMADEVDLVVATSAFGMGIDKPDVRYVVHADVPESPDTYYQEVGRAGRDGEPSHATLVYRPEDLSLGKFFSTAVPKRADVSAVLAAEETAGTSDPRAVAEHCAFGPQKAGRLLNLLALAREIVDGDPGAGELVAVAVERAEARRRLEQSRVEMMRGYAETRRCRAELLLAYFGEETDRLCGHCDNCRDGVATPPAAGGDAAFPLRSLVRHGEFGEGTVTDVEDDRITVLFQDVGYRSLSLELVEQHGLLERA